MFDDYQKCLIQNHQSYDTAHLMSYKLMGALLLKSRSLLLSSL